MAKKKSFYKCVDRYALIEKTNENYVTRGKVFDQSIVISTPNISYEKVQKINEDIIKSAIDFETCEEHGETKFTFWLTHYLNNIDQNINVKLNGQIYK